MNEARAYGSAALHQNLGFLITGGQGPRGIPSAEISTDGGVTFSDFNFLDHSRSLYFHCIVALNGDNGDFFVGAGFNQHSGSGEPITNRAFILRGNQWVEVTPMPTARYGKKSNLEMVGEMNMMLCMAGLVCGPIRTSPGGKVEKIVAAGGRIKNTVEVYDITTDTWTTGVCKYKGKSQYVADIYRWS